MTQHRLYLQCSLVNIWLSSSFEAQAHFARENTTISPGLAKLICKFTVEMKPSRILHEKKHNGFSRVGGGDIYIYSQNEAQAHFTKENTPISPGLAGVTFKFTIKMKARRILHEKTQRFLRGRRE